MFKSKKKSGEKLAADSKELGVICAVFGFTIVFLAVMTPILHILEQNKRLEEQARR